jgi:hypothetical protein
LNRKSKTQEEERGKEGHKKKKKKKKVDNNKRTNEKVSRSRLRFQMRTRDKASPESTSSGKSHKASSFNNAKLQLIFCKCTLYVAGKA